MKAFSNGLPNPDRWRSILEAINRVLETVSDR